MLVGIFALSMVPLSTNASSGNFNAETVKDMPQLIKGSNNYGELKETYRNQEQNWDEARNQWVKIKGKASKFGSLSGEDTTDVIDKLKEFLTLTTDRVIIKLQLLSHWVDRVIEDEEVKEKLLAEIEQEINSFEDLKTSVENAKTVEELREISQKIKNKWLETKYKIKRIGAEITSHRIEKMIEKFESLSDRLHSKIDGLDQNNKLVGQMQDLLMDFDEEVTSARKNYEQFLGIYEEEATSIDDLTTAREYLKSINRDLRDAHKIVKDVIKLYREYIGNIAPENEKPVLEYEQE